MIICKFELIKLGVSVDTWDWNLEFSRKIENFVIFRLDALALSVIATATCLAGWVAGWLMAVTLRYCIKTAKPIRKLFQSSESPITLVSWDPWADTKLHGEPLHGA